MARALHLIKTMNTKSTTTKVVAMSQEWLGLVALGWRSVGDELVDGVHFVTMAKDVADRGRVAEGTPIRRRGGRRV